MQPKEFLTEGRDHVVFDKFGTSGCANAQSRGAYANASDMSFSGRGDASRAPELRRAEQERRCEVLKEEAALLALIEATKASYFPQGDQELFLEIYRLYTEVEEYEMRVVEHSRTVVARSWRLLADARARGARPTTRKHRRNIRAAVGNVTELFYDSDMEMTAGGQKAAWDFRRWVAELTGSRDWADSLDQK